jgi:hypothetical protein
MAIGSAADLIAKRGAYTNRVPRFVFLADETLRLEIENQGVAGVIGSKRPTESPAGGYGLELVDLAARWAT